MITRIAITETVHTMGETSEHDAERFVDFLRAELMAEYPDAKISVSLNNHISSTQIYAEGSVDDDGCPTEMDPESTVQEFINSVWEKWC